MQRCKWCNLQNELYVKYHDTEWGILHTDDKYLTEIFILECFVAGLSWECVLNKRESFRIAFDNFDINKISHYDEIKINELLNNSAIIRHRAKIQATINNAKCLLSIISEYGSFFAYLQKFGNIIYETGKTHNELSDKISKDLSNRGMKFVGTITIYAFLQAIGIIKSHDKNCFLSK